MSVASPPAYSIRPEDKAFEALFPSPDDPLTSSFDQYVNGDLFEDAASDKEYLFLGETGILTEQNDTRFSPIGAHSKREPSSPQPWRKGLWCLSQTEATSSRLHVEKQRSKTQNVKQFQGPSNLTSQTAAGLHTDTPRPKKTSGLPSPPSPTGYRSSPSPQKTKYPMSGSQTVRFRNPYHRQQHLLRTASASPSPMRPNHYQQPDSFDEWQQDFKNFNLQIHDASSLPLSPPPSGRPVHEFQNATVASHAQMLHNGQMISQSGLGILNTGHGQPNFVTPATLTSPNFLPYGTSTASHPNEQAILSPPPQGHPPPAWVHEAFQSPADDTYYDFSSDLPTPSQNQQPWWASPPNSASHPPQEFYQSSIAAPTPQRPSHPIVHSPGFQNGGLMIHYPDQPQMEMSTVEPVHGNYSTSTLSSAHNTFSPHPHSYPMPPSSQADIHLVSSHNLNVRHPSFTQHDPFSTPQHARFPVSPSRSPSCSPTATLKARRQRSLSPQKSLENLKVRGRNTTPHHAGVAKTPRTPRTPRTPTNGFGAIDFVNFTPKDSMKLLSDVAPSGSSKTRARREQEAREKRRKLSEAAIRAVRQAGGDIDTLEEILC